MFNMNWGSAFLQNVLVTDGDLLMLGPHKRKTNLLLTSVVLRLLVTEHDRTVQFWSSLQLTDFDFFQEFFRRASTVSRSSSSSQVSETLRPRADV